MTINKEYGALGAAGGPCAVRNPQTGQVEQPRDYYALLDPDNADPWASETLATNENADGWVHKLDVAHRGSSLSRWRITRADGVPLTDEDVLRRVDMGQAGGENERWAEDRNGSEGERNPTMMGAIIKPDASPTTKLYPSPPLHSRIYSNGDSLTVEGATIPLEFDSYGTEVLTHAENGGNEDTPILLWQARMFARTTVNWQNLSNVCHRFFASYWPHAIDASVWSVSALIVSSLWLTDGFLEGSFYDPESREITLWDGTVSTGNPGGIDFAAWDRVNLDATRTTTSVSGGPGSSSAPAQFATPYGSVLLEDTARQLCVGLYARIGPGDRLQREPTEIAISQIRNVAHPAAGVDVNSGQRMSIRARSTLGRGAGWRGLQWWFAWGATQADVRAKIDTLHALGVANNPLPWSSIPPWVLAGVPEPDYA